MANGNPPPPDQMPAWTAQAGAVFGGITLVFFMGLVVAAVSGHHIPSDARFLVLIVLALGAAMSVAFIGGTAAAEGNIPLPWFQQHAIAVSAGGGIATLMIILLLGYYLYVRTSADVGPDYVLVPVPSEIVGDITIQNESTDSISDLGELRTNGKNRYVYIQFRHDGKKEGAVKIRYLKADKKGFDEATYAVDQKGKFNRQSK